MKLETFIDKFDQFVETPNAVAKIRELILRYALQGKLVKQRSNDGCTSKLMSAISHERDSRKRIYRIPTELTSSPTDQYPHSIPSNWVWSKLGNIALQIQYGYTTSAVASATEIRMLRITDIQNNSVDWPEVPGCVIETKNANKYLLVPNDILIARTGGTIGKSFIVSDVPVKSVFASYLIRITPPRAMVAAYLKRFFESPIYWMQLRQMSTGTGQPNINGKALSQLVIPLPPFAEQKRIVAKVDELMALCDRLEAQHQERNEIHSALTRASLARFTADPTPSNLNFIFHRSYDIAPADFRNAILTLALRGKLVPQNPEDEPARHLLARIQDVRERLIQERTLKRVKVEPNPTNYDSKDVPTNWIMTRLGNCYDVRDGTHDTPKYTNAGFPLITSKNISSGNLVLDGANFISEKDHKKICERSQVNKDDVLFAMIGSIGNPVIVDTDQEFSIKNMALFKYYTRIDSEPQFLLLYLKFVAEEMRENAAGGVQSFVSLGFLRNFIFPLPPLAEQRRIVAKVDQLMALVDDLEAQLDASRVTAQKLLEALVGELTSAGTSSLK